MAENGASEHGQASNDPDEVQNHGEAKHPRHHHESNEESHGSTQHQGQGNPQKKRRKSGRRYLLQNRLNPRLNRRRRSRHHRLIRRRRIVVVELNRRRRVSENVQHHSREVVENPRMLILLPPHHLLTFFFSNPRNEIPRKLERNDEDAAVVFRSRFKREKEKDPEVKHVWLCYCDDEIKNMMSTGNEASFRLTQSVMWVHIPDDERSHGPHLTELLVCHTPLLVQLDSIPELNGWHLPSTAIIS
nr:hypothetical protein Iba_chr13dCG1630 [Ipomoea batatas]